MKPTLLDLTQNILSRMSSDEVNSISDTPESLQVANIIRNKYNDIISRGDLTTLTQPFQLEPSLDSTQPVVMYIPEGVSKVEWIKYFDSNILDTADGSGHDINTDIISSPNPTDPPPPGYKYVTMLPVRQFLDMVQSFNPTEDIVESFTFTGNSNGYPGEYTFYYKNDRQPSFCTVLSNYYVIFDSFDNTQDSTLQRNKTMCFGAVVPVFQMVDSFVLDLDTNQFNLLLAEATALAFYELKQQPHELAMREANRQWSAVQKNKNISGRPSDFDALPDFGRRGLGFRSGVSFFKTMGWDR